MGINKEDVLAGLTEDQARNKLRRFGFNEIAKKKKKPAWLKLLSYFKNPLIIILIIAASISGMAGEFKNMVIIITMVVISIVMNFYQEHKSGKAAENISERLATTARVIRNGLSRDILVKYIVPGDIVVLSAGDIVPADGEIIESDDFFVNESALTGESLPVEKTADPASNKTLAGTSIVSGSGKIKITSTGAKTEFGKIADKLASKEEVTAFEVGIKNFGFLIIKMVVFIVLIIFLINIYLKRDLLDTFTFAIAVAVGLTPELLPVIMSVNMSKGSVRMSQKGVIVKRLNAIPDFGSMDILCTDKTGTLTEDKIAVVKYVDFAGDNSEHVLRQAYINSSMETGLKSAMDRAIMDFRHIDISGLEKVDEIPYDFQRKRLSVIYLENGNHMMITKGAPEEIFRVCTSYLDRAKTGRFDNETLKKATNTYESLSAQGFRVLALASKDVDDSRLKYPKQEESGMTLCGFISFYDPPKQSAAETLKFIRQHEIEVKVITGDSLIVSEKTCRDLGFDIKGTMSGDRIDLDQIDDTSLGIKAENTTIFARFSPSQKERIISVLRKRGHTVGYLGDGINDAPSLKTADVGISVSNAVDVAKETADIILMQKGLKELMDGVIEGRKIFGNTMKYLMMGLSSNFGNMFSMIGAVLYLPFFPMLPGQILLNNLLYDSSQMSIPTDNVDDEYLKKPKHWNMGFIRNFMFVFGPISTVFDFLTFYLLFNLFRSSAAQFQTGWFIESLASQIFVVYIIRTKKLPFIESSPSKYLLITTLGMVGAGLIIVLTRLGAYFGFSPLPLRTYGAILFLLLLYLGIVEAIKHLFYRHLSQAED